MAKQCYFIDHTFVDEYQMAKLSAKVEENQKDFQDFLKTAMLLRTCHRIEFYFNESPSINPLKEILGHTSSATNEDKSTFLRLVEIACGVKSKIVGEKYIFEQVRKSAEILDDNHPFKPQALSALSIAKELREKNSFYAPIDYEKIVSRQLSSFLKQQSITHKLLVIGSGMLSKSIVNQAQEEGINDILIISRGAKKLKKKGEFKDKVSLCSIHNIPDNFLKSNFHCFIATTNIDKTYKENLLPIINRKECLTIVDLSSLPAFYMSEIQGKDYITMYHDIFKKYVNENNELIKDKLENIKREIAFRCKEYYNN